MRKFSLFVVFMCGVLCVSATPSMADYAAAAMSPGGKGGMTWNHSSRAEAEAQAYKTCRTLTADICSHVTSIYGGWILGMYCSQPDEEVFLVSGETLEDAFKKLAQARKGYSKCVLKIRINSEGLH